MAKRQASKRARIGSKESVRLALNRGLIRTLVRSGYVETTLHRAREVRPLVDVLITTAREDSLSSRRMVTAKLGQDEDTAKLFLAYAGSLTDRVSGYTRIIKLGQRKGDSSPIARLEWIDKAKAPIRQTQGEPIREPQGRQVKEVQKVLKATDKSKTKKVAKTKKLNG